MYSTAHVFRGGSGDGYLKPSDGGADDVRKHVILIAKLLVVRPTELGVGRIARVVGVQRDKLLRRPHRQRAQHQGVDQAEDRGVGADAERQ